MFTQGADVAHLARFYVLLMHGTIGAGALGDHGFILAADELGEWP